MAGDLSAGTTSFSNLSIGGNDSNGALFGNIWAGSTISAPNVQTLTVTGLSAVSASRVTVGTFFSLQASTATADFAQGTVLSWRTIAASALTASNANTVLRDREILITAGGASGMSIAIRSNGTTYVFSSTLSSAGA